MSQPFPSYYLTRPDHVQVPLIPLDELPHWIEVGNWDWSDTSLFTTMDPVSCHCIPRSGEYDVLCHYCASSVDKLHRSVSQQTPPGVPISPTTIAHSTSTTIVRRPTSYAAKSTNRPYSSLVAQGILPAVAPFLSRPTLMQPVFHASLRSPFVGMCLLDCDSPCVMYERWRNWRRERDRSAGDDGGISLANLHEKFLNRKSSKPEAGPKPEEPVEIEEESKKELKESRPKPEESGQKPEGPGPKPEEPAPVPPTHDQELRPRSRKSGGQQDSPWEIQFAGAASPDNQEGLTDAPKAPSTYRSASSGGSGLNPPVHWPLLDRYCRGLLPGDQEKQPNNQRRPSSRQGDSPPRNQGMGPDEQTQLVRGCRHADLKSRHSESDQESEASESSANGPLSPLSAMVNSLSSIMKQGQRENPPFERVPTRQDETPDDQDTSPDSASRCEPIESTDVALPQLRLPSPVARVDFDPWAFDCLKPEFATDAAVPGRGVGLPSKSRLSTLSIGSRSRMGQTRDSVGSLISWETISTESSMEHEDGTDKTHEPHDDMNSLFDPDTADPEWLRNECRLFGLSPVDSKDLERSDKDAAREAEATFLSYWDSSNPEEPVKGEQSDDKKYEAHVTLGTSKCATSSEKRERNTMDEEHQMTETDKAVLKAQTPFPPLRNPKPAPKLWKVESPFPPLQKPKPTRGILRTAPGVAMVHRRVANRRVSFHPRDLSRPRQESSQAAVLSVDDGDEPN